MSHVEQQQQRSGVRRHVQAGRDEDDVQGCYRRVETLCRELQVGSFCDNFTNRASNSVIEQSAGRHVEEPGGAESGTLTIQEGC